MSTANANGRRSVMSVRSFAAFEGYDDDDDEGEGNVTEILKRRSSLGTSVAEAVASPMTFRRIWAETANLTSQTMSVQSNPERGQGELVIVTAPGEPQPAETCSPSSPDRSLFSQATKSRENSSYSSLAPRDDSILHGLQSKGPIEQDGLEPLAEKEIDPASFDLISPGNGPVLHDTLETRSEALFSTDHLKVIFNDPLLLQRFIAFLYAFRPKSVPLLVYYLDASKALKAINYANSITQTLMSIKGLDFSQEAIPDTLNGALLEKTSKAFRILAEEDLPAYITHVWTQMVSTTIKRRIADTLPDHLKDLSDGLAEVFCLTDPSRHGNPVIFASKEFYEMAQYGTGYVLGRNCRFLQGPYTNSSSLRRIKENLESGKEHSETLLNYRRDGSPFMNLLMVAPLLDSRGTIRYHIGAQVDVSGLAKECAGLESLKRLLSRDLDESHPEEDEGVDSRRKAKDEFRELAKMFSLQELKTAREAGGSMQHDEVINAGGGSSRRNSRLLIPDNAEPDPDPPLKISVSSGGRLSRIYEHYLLVRPYPSLRVLFASPSLRIPGMLQSNFMARVGGSHATREAIIQAFADGRGVTAKIRWLTRTDNHGRKRWIHCTPLLGKNDVVGVWMVVLVDDDTEAMPRRTRDTPPVESHTSRGRPFDRDTVDLPGLTRSSKGDKPRPSSAMEYASGSGNIYSPTPRSNNSA